MCTAVRWIPAKGAAESSEACCAPTSTALGGLEVGTGVPGCSGHNVRWLRLKRSLQSDFCASAAPVSEDSPVVVTVRIGHLKRCCRGWQPVLTPLFALLHQQLGRQAFLCQRLRLLYSGATCRLCRAWRPSARTATPQVTGLFLFCPSAFRHSAGNLATYALSSEKRWHIRSSP